MSQAKGHRGQGIGRRPVVPVQPLEQQAPEDALLHHRRQEHGAHHHHPPGLPGHGCNGGIVHILQARLPEADHPADEQGAGVVHRQPQNHCLEEAPKAFAHHHQRLGQKFPVNKDRRQEVHSKERPVQPGLAQQRLSLPAQQPESLCQNPGQQHQKEGYVQPSPDPLFPGHGDRQPLGFVHDTPQILRASVLGGTGGSWPLWESGSPPPPFAAPDIPPGRTCPA